MPIKPDLGSWRNRKPTGTCSSIPKELRIAAQRAQDPDPHPIFFLFLREPRNQGFREIYFLFEFQEENKIKHTIEQIFVLGKHSKSSQL